MMRKLLFILVLLGCSSPNQGTVDPIGPDRANFEPVLRMMNRRCGSLDCHGNQYRNMRLYGYSGIRIDPTLYPEDKLRPAEVDASYEAVVSLEPELMREVVLERGFNAERLTLVRKARGLEKHEGNAPIAAGDDADVCLRSWLSSATDTKACLRVPDQP